MEFQYNSVGFIGLGVMGFPMAENLAQKLPEHVKLYVFDVASTVVQDLAQKTEGRVSQCKSSKEVAEKSDIVLSMVPEGSHVRAVYLNPENGVLVADVSGKILIDCSTIDTGTSLAVCESLTERWPSASFYDAPVSGGSLGAQKGTLTFMLGCEREDPNFPFLKTLLGMMGSSIFPCGKASMGITAKLCNNYCSGLIALATAEAMNIGMQSGIDPRTLADIFAVSTAQSTICDKWCPVPGVCPDAPSSNGYKGGFKVQLMRKDFALAVDAAKRVGAKLTLGEAGLDTYTEAMNDPNCRDLDSRVVFRYLGGNEDWQKDFSK